MPNRGKPGKRNDASGDSTGSGVMVEGVSRVGLVQIPSHSTIGVV